MTARPPFAGTRVVEFSSGISAGYAGKLFTDTGAEVVKIEPGSGDPLRRWSLSPHLVEPASGEDGVLFGYLHAGKRSVVADLAGETAIDGLLAGADLVLTDGSDGRTAESLRAAVGPEHPSVIVSITPFGLDGPYVEAGLEANEFLLQALCGSIGSRGWPGETPFQAGGRPGEWVAGVYAAVAAAASVRGARTSGRGVDIDVSALEAMVITMGGLQAVSAGITPDQPPLTRSLELPSIVPTADGLVGFCTITAQQFADFLVMIDRIDLIDDRELSTMAGRVARRAEFETMVLEWAATRTTAEIIDLGVALRIPIAPIGRPATVTEIDHFREREVFVKNAAGSLQPRTPFRSPAIKTAVPGEVPALGSSDPQDLWTPRAPRPAADGAAPADPRPLAGVRVLDFTAFWAGPVATLTLAALGADVIKVEGLKRPDGMRFAGGYPPTEEDWWESGGVFLTSNYGKRGITLELSLARAREIVLDLVRTADLVVENFSPRVLGNLGLEYEVLREANPRAVVMRMPAFGLDGPWRDRVGFAQTMEQATGMAWVTGYADGQPVIPRGVCDPVSGLHAVFAAIAGLEVRDATGEGMQIESTMVEAVLSIAAEALLETEAGHPEPGRDGNRGPGASPQGVYQCSDGDSWVALAVLDDAQLGALATAIDRPDLAERADLATVAGRRLAADELDAAIGRWTAGRPSADALAALRAAGVPSTRVNEAAGLLADPQLVARGFWQTADHPVVGPVPLTGMPFRLSTVSEPWARTPAPLFGEHNREIFGGLLGMDDATLAELTEAKVIGTRPEGL